MTNRILRRKQVCERVGLSWSTLARAIKAGRFPSPIKLSAQAIGFFEHEVEAWLQERADRRDAAQAVEAHDG